MSQSLVQQAENDVDWWTAANLEHPGAFGEQLKLARARLKALLRATRSVESARLPAETVERIMAAVTTPDLLPVLLHDLAGEALLYRSGRKVGYVNPCPFCGNAKWNFELVLSGPKCGLWVCRACNEGGTLRWLLMRRSGLPYRELLERLAGYGGIVLETEPARNGRIYF